MGNNPQKRLREENKAKFEGFQQWMSKPETKFMISMLPESPPDLIKTITESAYRQGFEHGTGHYALEVQAMVMKAVLDGKKGD